VTVLVWVYYSAQLFFLGAEFTKIYSKKYGSHFAQKLQPNAPQQELATVLAPDGQGVRSERLHLR
jgi:uncharacterized BrkB/YihY/UPF0761 family membrane protein